MQMLAVFCPLIISSGVAEWYQQTWPTISLFHNGVLVQVNINILITEVSATSKPFAIFLVESADLGRKWRHTEDNKAAGGKTGNKAFNSKKSFNKHVSVCASNHF